MSQIIQSLLSAHAEHKSFRDVKELKVEYDQLLLQSALEKLMFLQSAVH